MIWLNRRSFFEIAIIFQFIALFFYFRNDSSYVIQLLLNPQQGNSILPITYGSAVSLLFYAIYKYKFKGILIGAALVFGSTFLFETIYNSASLIVGIEWGNSSWVAEHPDWLIFSLSSCFLLLLFKPHFSKTWIVAFALTAVLWITWFGMGYPEISLSFITIFILNSATKAMTFVLVGWAFFPKLLNARACAEGTGIWIDPLSSESSL